MLPVVSQICRFAPQLHESVGGLPSLKLSLHSCSLPGSTNAMGIETSIALVLPAREHECDTSFVLGRPPALSQSLPLPTVSVIIETAGIFGKEPLLYRRRCCLNIPLPSPESTAAMDCNIKTFYGLNKKVTSVKNVRKLTKLDMKLNDALPNIEVDPETYAVTADGNHSNVSFASVPDTPSMVLDDSCVYTRGLSRHVMGKVKDVTSIPNMLTLLTKEGFSGVKLTYLGGLWVMIELINESVRNNLLLHTGVKSWFHVIQLATHDFVSDERNVWVDIEGVPLNMWSRETFIKIGKKWGEIMDIEENLVASFARKRLCIKSNRPDNILEKFKIIYKGKVYLACAKELFAWTPSFLNYKEPEYVSDDEVLHSARNNSVGPQHRGEDFVIDRDIDGVSDTIFDDIHELDPSLSHPPGFTPKLSQQEDDFINDGLDNGIVKENPPFVHSQAMNSSKEFHVNEVSKGHSELSRSHNQKGGSILELLDDMVWVGKSMGYEMEGCIKDIGHIIRVQGDD
ncbi:RNA-directed DNA polymerase, eukaryota, partial [Tanacetum coccineum]